MFSSAENLTKLKAKDNQSKIEILSIYSCCRKCYTKQKTVAKQDDSD